MHCQLPISPDLAQSQDSPLTAEELIATIKQMKLGKSPGPDGFTTHYFQEVLLPFFLRAFNEASSSAVHAPQFLEAHIAVLPKDTKDPALVTNY